MKDLYLYTRKLFNSIFKTRLVIIPLGGAIGWGVSWGYIVHHPAVAAVIALSMALIVMFISSYLIWREEKHTSDSLDHPLILYTGSSYSQKVDGLHARLQLFNDNASTYILDKISIDDAHTKPKAIMRPHTPTHIQIHLPGTVIPFKSENPNMTMIISRNNLHYRVTQTITTTLDEQKQYIFGNGTNNPIVTKLSKSEYTEAMNKGAY